jgi:hypothetical protein
MMMENNDIPLTEESYEAVLHRLQDYLDQSLNDDVSNYIDFCKDEIMKEIEGE